MSMNAMSPEQIVMTALHDLAVASVEAWKQNDDAAMSAAIECAHKIVAGRLAGTDALYSALFRIVREDTALGEIQGMEVVTGRLGAFADATLREYQHLISTERGGGNGQS